MKILRLVTAFFVAIFSAAVATAQEAGSAAYCGFWGGQAEFPMCIHIKDGKWVGETNYRGFFELSPRAPDEFGEFQNHTRAASYYFTPIGDFYVAEEWRNGDLRGIGVLRENAPKEPAPRPISGGKYTGPWGGQGDFLAAIEVSDEGLLVSFLNGERVRDLGPNGIAPSSLRDFVFRTAWGETYSFIPVENYFIAIFVVDEGTDQERRRGLAVLESVTPEPE